MQVSKLLIALVSIFAATLTTTDAAAGKKEPSPAAIAFAQETSDLLTNTVVAALLQEISETTADNVQQGNLSIGIVFDDANLNMRLVGELDPLRDNDYPRDAFEEDALAQALAGVAATSVEKVGGKWYYRRSVPLTNFAPQCALCHENFAALPSSEYVGALMLRVPIPK